MKKLIYFAVVACLALAACTKNEVTVMEGGVTSDQLITFTSPVVGVPTKGEVGYPTDYPSFHVLGRIHTGDYNGWNSSGSYEIGDYMDTEVKYDVSLDPKAWAPYPYAYYWPKNETYKLSFIAYSPNGAKGASIGETGVKFDNYVVADPTIDLLYSNMTYNQISTTSTGVNDGSEAHTDPLYPQAPAYQGVNLHFKHALSSINFKVKTAEDFTATAKITLTGITVSSINKQGSFNQNLTTSGSVGTAGPIEGTQAPAWTDQTGAETYNVTLSSTLTDLTTTEQVAGSELILLPQPLVTTTQKVRINYTTQSKIGEDASGDPIFGIAVPSYADVYFFGKTGSGEGVNKWEIGKKYIYTISIGLKKIYFAPEVIDWNTGSTTDISI